MMTPFWVVMGVSGAGKTEVGRALAGRMGWDFIDADDYHPPANVERMRQGLPLDDAMRGPWFDRLITVAAQAQRPTVMACSALKRAYRDRLRAGIAGYHLIYLDAPREVVLPRIAARKGHYFDPTLLDSQYAALEPPTPDEGAVVHGIDESIDEIAAALAAKLV